MQKQKVFENGIFEKFGNSNHKRKLDNNVLFILKKIELLEILRKCMYIWMNKKAFIYNNKINIYLYI